MVEDSVKNDSHSQRMCFVDEFLEIFFCSDVRIDLVVIDGVVFVDGVCFEDRGRVNDVDSEFFYMIEVIDDASQISVEVVIPSYRILVPEFFGDVFRCRESCREDLIDDFVFKP